MTIRLVGESASGVGTQSQPSSTAEVGFETATALSDASGRFTLLGVPSGEYVLREANSNLMRVARLGLTAYSVSQQLSVGDRDVTDLTVTVKPALQIEGRVEFRGAAGPQPMPQRTVSGLVAFESPFLERRFAAETSRETQTFSAVAAAGQYFVRPYEGNGWYVQSVKAGDTDVTDRLVDLQTNTRHHHHVDGPANEGLRDRQGRARRRQLDRDRAPVSRRSHAVVGVRHSPRNFKSGLTSAAGGFTFEHVPIGEYYVVAVDRDDADDWQDPQKLEALARRATTLTVVRRRHGEDDRSRGGGGPMSGARRTLALVMMAVAFGAVAYSPLGLARDGPFDFAHGRQVREGATAAKGAASIAGAVFVDGASKQPARRVRVTLTELGGLMTGQTTTTDDSGAFAFRALPAGRFELQAFKAGYLKGSYGAARPNRAGTPIVVKDGETIANLTMTIARGGVITGVVRDGRGRPLPGLEVRVLKFGYNALSGERTLGAPSTGSTATTDDRGEYRAFGLPPGGYLVVFSPPPGRSGGPGVGRHPGR